MKLFILRFLGNKKTTRSMAFFLLIFLLFNISSCNLFFQKPVVAPEKYLFTDNYEEYSYQEFCENDTDDFSRLCRICDIKYYKEIEDAHNVYKAYTMFNTDKNWIFVIFRKDGNYDNYYSINVNLDFKSPIDDFENVLGKNIEYIFDKCKNDNSMYFYRINEPTSSIHIFDKCGYYLEYENSVVKTIKKFTL